MVLETLFIISEVCFKVKVCESFRGNVDKK